MNQIHLFLNSFFYITSSLRDAGKLEPTPANFRQKVAYTLDSSAIYRIVNMERQTAKATAIQSSQLT